MNVGNNRQLLYTLCSEEVGHNFCGMYINIGTMGNVLFLLTQRVDLHCMCVHLLPMENALQLESVTNLLCPALAHGKKYSGRGLYFWITMTETHHSERAFLLELVVKNYCDQYVHLINIKNSKKSRVTLTQGGQSYQQSVWSY